MYIINVHRVYLSLLIGDSMIRVKVIDNPNNLFYDLNGICENADSIFWTLVPKEIFSIYESNPYLLTKWW